MKKLLASLLALTLILALAPAALASGSSGTPYPAVGGNIYIDEATKTVVGADKTVTSVTIPDGVTSIGWAAFRDCASMTDITIPDSVTSIRDFAFKGCAGLTSITIPDGVTSIGLSVFSDCVSLTGITIPDGVTSIGESAFYGCSGLTGVTIPDGVTSIGEEAFGFCDRLTFVTIPASVTSIGNWAFEFCPSLSDVYFGGSEAQWNAALKRDDVFTGYYVTVRFNSTGPVGRFVDLESWSEAPVNWAVDNNFADAMRSSVFGARYFCPRWEVVDMLWKAMGAPEPTATSVPFTDVDPSAPYFKAVCWAYEQEITNGINPTTFGPDTTVERGDAMTFLYRAAKKPAVTVTNTFPDVPVGEYYAAPITWAVNQKVPVAQGANDGRFYPEDPVTRAQMVTFLYRWVVENK